MEEIETEKLKGFENWEKEDKINQLRSKIQGQLNKVEHETELLTDAEELLGLKDRTQSQKFEDHLDCLIRDKAKIESGFVNDAVEFCKRALTVLEELEVVLSRRNQQYKEWKAKV